MAITNGYITLPQFKERMWPNNSPASDADRDAEIETMIEAASRKIDNHCGRRFYAATETRYFTAEWHDLLLIDDLISVTTLKTDDDEDRTYETTWQATDYDLEPYNAPYDVPPHPYIMIRVTANGDYSFPERVRRGIEIAGSWGWAATAPEPISEACWLLAGRLFKRKDALLGVAGASQFGQTTQKTPTEQDAFDLIEDYIRAVP